jgi:tetratricopeptide (TPR) repeat protein
VLILGIGQLALITILINLIGRGSPASLAWQSLVFLTMVILVIGLAFRRFWAYAGSILFLLMLVAAMILSSSLGPTVDSTLSQLAGKEFFLRIGENPYELFIGPASSVVRLLQYVAVPIALLYALLKVGPDFERTKVRRTAQLDRGVSDASHFNGTGEAYAAQGMLATAVLHFQRAAALEPANPFYQRKLGGAYAQLGHYQRSLDVLESARQLTRDPEAQAAIERQMAGIRQKTQPAASDIINKSQAA